LYCNLAKYIYNIGVYSISFAMKAVIYEQGRESIEMEQITKYYFG
jgi:hypothetical protein